MGTDSAFTRPPVAPRVLVVDDDASSRRYFRAALTKQGYEVVTANDAVEAQARIYEYAEFDGALFDYRMPGMSGIELLAWLRRFDPNVATVLVTAEGDKGVVEKALTEGACGFLNKPVDFRDLQREVKRAVQRSSENRRLNNIVRHVEQVGESQRSLLATGAGTATSGIRLSHFPHHHAGGDFLVRFPVSDTEMAVLAADVSGHDLKAAFLAAYFQGLTRGMLHRGAPVHEILEFANRLLLEEWSSAGRTGDHRSVPPSISLCALVINSLDNTFTVFANGCPLPVVVDAEGNVETVATPAYPLGWFDGVAAHPTQHTWQPGSSVRLWTDGVEDIAGTLGVDPLSVVFALGNLKADAPRPDWLLQSRDDILAAAIALARGDQPAGFDPLIRQSVPGHQRIPIEELQEGWRRSLTLALGTISGESMFNILLCAREALLNATRYGCGSDQCADLQMSYHPARQQVRLICKDPGAGHDFAPRTAGDGLHSEHRGLELIGLLASHVTSLRRGAELRIDLDIHFETECATTTHDTKKESTECNIV